MMVKALGLAVTWTLFAIGTARSQAIPAADVKIQSITATDEGADLLCKVQVQSDNDDDAQNVRLTILFPLSTHFLSSNRTCTVGPAFGTDEGFAVCRLNTIIVGQVKTTNLRTSLPPGFAKRCSAFVRSDVPDPNSSNNFASATAP
jgi:hypothetical protein